jgi:enoyl-CoA hydratase/carnithine racemase
MLAATTGPNAVTTAKRQLTADLLRHDPAASITDSLRLLDQAMGTAEYRKGVAALTEKRPPNF